MICAPSEDSYQPGHPPNLIRVFAVRPADRWGPNVSSCGQQRLWSDWANAQADLSRRLAQTSFCWFCNEATHSYCRCSEKQRDWSDCTDAQADLRLRCSPMTLTGFAMMRIKWRQEIFSVGHIQEKLMNRRTTNPTKWHMRPAKRHISLGIRPVWSESSLCALWIVLSCCGSNFVKNANLSLSTVVVRVLSL